MNYFLYLIFAILPSLIWLSFYLRQDKRPEPKRMVIKIFILGMIVAFPAIFFEKIAIYPYNILERFNHFLAFTFYIFIGIAFVEEFFKYLVLRLYVLKNPEFDEPFDALLYLIIAALGFSALENLLLFFQSSSPGLNALPSFQEMVFTSLIRCLTATFLHALCAGILGYFIALSFYKTGQRTKLTISGLALVTLLHGFYNFSIMNLEGNLKYLGIVVLLISMASLLGALILKIKKLPSICK